MHSGLRVDYKPWWLINLAVSLLGQVINTNMATSIILIPHLATWSYSRGDDTYGVSTSYDTPFFVEIYTEKLWKFLPSSINHKRVLYGRDFVWTHIGD